LLKRDEDPTEKTDESKAQKGDIANGNNSDEDERIVEV